MQGLMSVLWCAHSLEDDEVTVWYVRDRVRSRALCRTKRSLVSRTTMTTMMTTTMTMTMTMTVPMRVHSQTPSAGWGTVLRLSACD
jgi:hypothetical protein